MLRFDQSKGIQFIAIKKIKHKSQPTKSKQTQGIYMVQQFAFLHRERGVILLICTGDHKRLIFSLCHEISHLPLSSTDIYLRDSLGNCDGRTFLRRWIFVS